MGLSVTGMVAAIEAAFAYEWGQAKPGVPVPEAGKEDRDLLFAAIARGVLKHLQAEQSETMNTITLSDGSVDRHQYTVDALTLNISIDR